MDDYINVYEGDIHIRVKRGTDWHDIKRLLNNERVHAEWKKRKANYLATHGPWNSRDSFCMSCNRTLLDIHACKLICNHK